MMYAAEESPPIDHAPAAYRGDGLFDNRELSTIAMIAALHFAVSFVARLSGTALYAFFGPFYVFPDGIGGEAIPCLLIAVIVTLVPRIGTATLTIGTVFLLNGIVSGSFSVSALCMVVLSIVVHELVLAALRVTRFDRSQTLPAAPAPAFVARMALAIGLANGVALYGQYFITIYFYKNVFPMWFVHSAALITGMLYGAIGAAIGCVWGFRLRRTAP